MSSRAACIFVPLALFAFGACGGSEKPAAAPDDRNVVQAIVAPVPDAGVQENASPSDTAERDRSREEIERVARERDQLEASTHARASKDAAGPDPLQGKFSLADATAGLSGTGALTATIRTSQGDLRCRLFDTKAPNTVANFVGLARGTRPWKDPATSQWVTRPAYDGTTFHRIIKGFMIQGGDPKGDGTGEPGYMIKDEIWPGAKHDRAGLLCMANRGVDTNGAQFFITDTKVAHLDGKYTIFGECSPASVVHAIAGVPVASPSSRPLSPVTIAAVEISRGKATP